MTAGIVYLIRSGTDSPAKCKIGRTKGTSEKRRKALTTGNPDKLVIEHEWMVEQDVSAFEREIHAHFASSKLMGDATEFFLIRDIPDAIHHINKIHEAFIARVKILQEASSIGAQNDDGFVDADEEIVNLLEARRALSAKLYLYKAERDLIDAKIKKHIGRKAGIAGKASTKLVTWKTQKMRRFDEAAFREAHADLHSAFLKESEIRRFVAKE